MPDQSSDPRNEPDVGPIVGIDLGTTNSLVAVANFPPGDPAAAAPRILYPEGQRAILPSVVRFNDDGSTTIGANARAEAVLHPTSTIHSAKRLMGRSIDDARHAAPYLSYVLVAGENNTARIALPDGKVVSPQEVSALILGALRERASTVLGTKVTRAVVTVPAYFDDAQRQATRDAGRLAKLDVVRIVNEPTAAALAYGIGLAPDTKASQTIAVFDLGGGTFDISILRLTPSPGSSGADMFQVLATAGDTALGGDDFDHALINLITSEIDRRFGSGAGNPEITFPPRTKQALRSLAEATKIRLSDEDQVPLEIDLSEPGAPEPRIYTRTVTRDEFESLITPLVERSIDACKRALRDAKRELEGDPIDAVVMVGGSTQVPLVRRLVREFFKVEPYTALHPEQVVALGAAVQASILAGTDASALLLDVVPLSLGLETQGGAVSKMILRNTAVPTRATEMYSTSADGQTSIKLNILQGEREMASDCRSLGVYHLNGIPPMPAGVPQLQVAFAVDANGVLSVHALERRSGKRLDVQIVPNHGLTRDEVERMERESFEHAAEDMTRHRVVDLVANARLDIKSIRAPLGRVRDQLDTKYAEQLDRLLASLESMVQSAESDWRSVDPNTFQQTKEALDRASVRLHEVAIADSLKADKDH